MKNKSGQLDKPTPETDAKVSFRVDVPSCVTVPVDLARKLERERDEARQELKEIAEYGTEEINAAVELRQKLASALIERDELRSECKALWVMVDTEKKKTYTALRERDEAREAATEQFIAAGKAARERDEAREQAAKWLARLQEEGLEEYGN